MPWVVVSLARTASTRPGLHHEGIHSHTENEEHVLCFFTSAPFISFVCAYVILGKKMKETTTTESSSSRFACFVYIFRKKN